MPKPPVLHEILAEASKVELCPTRELPFLKTLQIMRGQHVVQSPCLPDGHTAGRY
jgi:hypothetical protein